MITFPHLPQPLSLDTAVASSSSLLFFQPYPQHIPLITADGSPSLRLKPDGESMHNLRGAFSESLYIYLRPLEWACQQGWSPRVFSLGLGLGYNEIISLAYFYKEKINHFSIDSYESEWSLRSYFLRFFQEDSPQSTSLYFLILKMAAKYFQVDLNQLFLFIKENLFFQLQIKGAVQLDSQFTRDYNVVYFDAYSEKTTSIFWDESFLDEFIGKVKSANCVLGTYAAKGSFSRILKKNNFKVFKIKGFGGKRNSTFAICLERGVVR